MSKKIKITEQQLKLITNIVETNSNVRLKNKIFNFLEADYKPVGGVKEIGNEYHNTGLIEKKIDGNTITPLALFEYLQHKFVGLEDKELKDIIQWWYDGEFDKDTGMKKKKKI